jgi:hypothetical protein
MNKDKEYYRQAVKRGELGLWKVPMEYQTEAVCLAAVERNGKALQYVPWTLRTETVCMEAVKQNGAALYFVPEGLRAAVERRLKEAGE